MGRRQHQKDKMYITRTEWTSFYGGKKTSEAANFRRLPFNYCCLSLQPYTDPYCDSEGNVFQHKAILEYLSNFNSNPVTGMPLSSNSLIKLNFSKNSHGEYQCPILLKQFGNNSRIAAISTTGNVFSYEAVEELNIKTKHWMDLLTNEPFERKDLIIIQDPINLEKFNLNTFHYIKYNLSVAQGDDNEDTSGNRKKMPTITQNAQNSLNGDSLKDCKQVADKFNSAHYSTGAVAAGFTSTALFPKTKQEPAIIQADLLLYERVKSKGYVRLVTNLGFLNLELHCDVLPKVCENFVKLAKRGYYNETKFHRSIRNFIIQGGDPTGTGNGGQSIWGKPFEDSFKPNLAHSGRGILSMANNGPNTNTSQFFITYRSCHHLDGKYTVFGRVVGGFNTLAAMENIETDIKDRPIEDITIESAQVFVDPYHEADSKLKAEREVEYQNRCSTSVSEKITYSPPSLAVYREGVGKYINMKSLATNTTNLSSV